VNSAIGVSDSEFLLNGGTKQREVSVSAELPEPGLDVEERRSKPSLLLIRVPPVIDAPAALLGLGAMNKVYAEGWFRGAERERTPDAVIPGVLRP
jgi:hypothetical protein